MSSLGTIISTEESPSTSEYAFVVETSDKNVRKGQYVQTESELGTIFGYVSEITRANRYFERAESVAEYERTSSIKDNFPISSWQYMIADVKILGAVRDGNLIRATLPPFPGSKVFHADETLLKKFLGFKDNGLLLGKIQHHSLEAKLDLTKLFQKHLAILAMSGAGKSHLCSVLIEELLNRKKEDGRIAVVVIDIHGEYVGFKYDPIFGKNTKIVEGKEMRVPLRKISPEMVEEWFPFLSDAQKQVLRQAMYDLRKENKPGKSAYTLKDLFTAIEESTIVKDNVKGPLKRTLSELRRYSFVSPQKESPKLLEDIESGKLLILDFSSIDSLTKKQILVSLIARRMFKLRKKGKIPPFLLVIEEAHNFAREKAEASQAISRSIIETMAREGRKFGAAICLITQRPVNLSTTALSQCNTHIILRITNPNDLQHIQMSSEGIDVRIAKSITSLAVGECVVVGEAVRHPIFIDVRNRKSTKRERGQPLDQQALEYEQKKEKKSTDVEAFL